MAEPTQDEIDRARRRALSGVTSVREGDRSVTYAEPNAILKAAEAAERRVKRRPHCGFVRHSKGY